MLSGFEDKTAIAQCLIGYVNSDEKIPHIIKGECKGSIVNSEGRDGFGWDVIFKPEGFNVTFSEMTMEEKNVISHRGLAVTKFVE
mmetsp:Transcript_28378/g.23816  ORF Transcript_28378/g.23816 Transcript_28378/m.23816 type:complete len:85 (+) Transcript_28378:318-572(+)